MQDVRLPMMNQAETDAHRAASPRRSEERHPRKLGASYNIQAKGVEDISEHS